MAYTKGIPGGGGFGRGGKGSGGGGGGKKEKIPTAYKIGGPKDKVLRAREKFQKSMKNSNLTKQDMKKAIGTGAALGAGSAIGMAGYLTATKKGIFATEERDRNTNKNPDVFEAKRIKNNSKAETGNNYYNYIKKDKK